MVAVCQPAVQALAAAAVMAQTKDSAAPRSMTLMAGPVDCRINPTGVNELATSKPIGWFERNLIATVPLRYPGALRRVYPGFVQLAAFMSMNVERHMKAHRELYDNLANGELEKAQVTKGFYDEYFAVLDLTAEFYLETVRLVFQECALPLGKLEWQGERVELAPADAARGVERRRGDGRGDADDGHLVADAQVGVGVGAPVGGRLVAANVGAEEALEAAHPLGALRVDVVVAGDERHLLRPELEQLEQGPRAGELGQALGQRLVDAAAGRLGRERDHPLAEYGGVVLFVADLRLTDHASRRLSLRGRRWTPR